MSRIIKQALDEMFGRARHKPARKTRVVAMMRGEEAEIVKGANGLWRVQLHQVPMQNSRLGDLVGQIEASGGTVERRPA